jgi:hypothetical protein
VSGYGRPDSCEPFEEWKAGDRMIELKFGTFLSRVRLTGIYCAEKIGRVTHRKVNGVRLFKD